MKLSVITVNYNNFEGLKKTAESILSQTWRDFEWIIIDGGSIDGSREYIVNLNEKLNQKGWNPISYWCSEPDKGVYNAMNKGIAKTRGDYLNFMNSGDIFYESKTLEMVFENEHNSDVVFGDWKRVWTDKDDIKSFPYPVEIYSFYKENICHQAMFIKREYHLLNLYDESYQLIADYKNWGIAAMKGATFERLNIIICSVTMDGISSQGGELRRREYNKLRMDLWSGPVGVSCERLDRQLNEPYQLRVRTLLAMNGIPRIITLGFLKLMKIIFLRKLDESWK